MIVMQLVAVYAFLNVAQDVVVLVQLDVQAVQELALALVLEDVLEDVLVALEGVLVAEAVVLQPVLVLVVIARVQIVLEDVLEIVVVVLVVLVAKDALEDVLALVQDIVKAVQKYGCKRRII